MRATGTRRANEGGRGAGRGVRRQHRKRRKRADAERRRSRRRGRRDQAWHHHVGASFEPRHRFGRRHRQPCVRRLEGAQHDIERRLIVVLPEHAQRFCPDAAIRIADGFTQPRRRLRKVDAGFGDERWRKAADRPETNLSRLVSSELQESRYGGWIARPKERPRRSPPRLGVGNRGPAENRRQVVARREPADREKRLSDDRGGSRL